jgi:hypothetical protein
MSVLDSARGRVVSITLKAPSIFSIQMLENIITC